MDGAEQRVKPKDGSELDPRPHAVDIYERICDDTVEELRRPPSSLAFSGLSAGNIAGGVMIVAAINYGQVRGEDGD